MVRLIFKRLLMVQLVVSSIATLGNTIDSVIVARMLGSGAIAACGLVNPFAIVTAAISDIIVSGTQISCSKSIGAGDTDRARKQLGVAFAASIVISAIIVALGYLFTDQLCLILGAERGTQLFSDTAAYARGLLPSLIPSTPIALMMFTCVSNGDLTRCRIGGGAIVCLNIVFSILSIVVFDGGLFGVGLATTIAMYLVFFYLLGHFRDAEAGLRPSFGGLAAEDLKQIILIGSPRATFKASTFLLILLFNNVLLDFYGQEYVAAYSVVRSIYSIVSFTTSALVYCTNLITSTFYGEENRRALHDTIREFTRLSLVIGVISFAFMFMFGRVLALLYLDAGTIIYETACSGLVLIAASLPFSAMTACLQNFFIATGHKRWGAILNILAILVFIPGAGFLLMPLFDAQFVFAAFPAGYFMQLVAIAVFAACKKHRSPLHADTYLFVPDDFGVPEDHELMLKVQSPSDLTQSKAEFGQFCQRMGFGAEGDRSFRALSLFADSRVGQKGDRKKVTCFARAFRKDQTMRLIVWNVSAQTGPNPISQTLNMGKELIHNGRLPKAKSKAAAQSDCGECGESEAQTQGRANENESYLNADLIELLEGCTYSLSNPFGLERLRIAFEAPSEQEPHVDNIGAGRSEPPMTQGEVSR